MAETETKLLTVDAVRLGCRAADRFDAVRQAGEVLVGLGAVEPEYADTMQERERSMSTYVGEGFAIPHGTDAARALVRHGALAFLQFPDGVDWDGHEVRACVAIAAAQNEHIGIMSRLAKVLIDPVRAEELRRATDAEQVVAILDGDRPDATEA